MIQQLNELRHGWKKEMEVKSKNVFLLVASFCIKFNFNHHSRLQIGLVIKLCISLFWRQKIISRFFTIFFLNQRYLIGNRFWFLCYFFDCFKLYYFLNYYLYVYNGFFWYYFSTIKTICFDRLKIEKFWEFFSVCVNILMG